ncbi:MAG TPA: ATP-binding protein [Gemmatimonadales bacterium]|nr:ATP-binding protein [Gemmatimonadales bacterium]
MSFRHRLLVAFLAVLLVPLGVLAFGVRRETERRLTAEYQERVRSLAGLVQVDLARESGRLGRILDALRDQLADDNRFRGAARRDDPADRRWLLDWAGGAQRLTGLDYLRLQDSFGRVLSSGHFRNEFDRVEPDVVRLVSSADSVALLRARTAERELLLVARADSFRVGGLPYALVGGIGLDAGALAPAARAHGLAVRVELPESLSAGRDAPLSVADAFSVPVVDARVPGAAVAGEARIVVTQSLAPLDAWRRSVDRWFLAALAATAAAAVLAAAWLAARVSRPLRELADKTARLDLDRLDVGFGSERNDEVGALARLLDAMAGRLRQGTVRLREAERRATVGDLARQVNHDVRNGLIPIRHVLAHFSEVAERSPGDLARVFDERRPTLESSVAYLETLARNYARLSPAAESVRCDVNGVAREVAAGMGGRVPVRLELAPELPAAQADPLVVRRVLENLVGNAIESLDGNPDDRVTIATDAADGWVRLTVADTGRGMSQAELDRVFEGFYTTKAGGTGLGLTIVRRLVQDGGGSLRVQSEPGAGSRFTVELPSHQEQMRSDA